MQIRRQSEELCQDFSSNFEVDLLLRLVSGTSNIVRVCVCLRHSLLLLSVNFDVNFGAAIRHPFDRKTR